MEKQSIRIPSLDGLRAISIFFVIYSHAFKPQLINFGKLGVKIFFIISSYLIVGILLKDIEKNRFSLRNFYFKRAMRIFPAFYIYLVIIFIFMKSINVFSLEHFWRAPLFIFNYQPNSSWIPAEWFVGHSWSLAVEEQFYVLIALLFLLVKKQFLNNKKMIYIFLSIIVIVPVIRICYLYFQNIPDFLKNSVNRSFETVADSLAVGAIFAILKDKIEVHRLFMFFKNKILFLFVLILGIMVLNSSLVSEKFGLKPRYIFNLCGQTIINFSIAIIILFCINLKKSTFIFRFLNHKFMITIGIWSYSIYLWQQVWFFTWEIPIIIKVAGTFVCAILSYYLVELNFLKVRDNYFLKKNQK